MKKQPGASLTQDNRSRAARETEGPEPGAVVVDSMSLLSRVAGDRETAGEVIATFLDDEPRMLQELMLAVSRSDRKAIFESAHRLKGALQTVGAAEASEAALRLEQMGRRSGLNGLQDAWTALEQAMRRLDAALVVLRQDLSPDHGEESP